MGFATVPVAANATDEKLPSCTYNEDFKRYLLPVVYTLVFLVGLPLNSAVILRIWKKRKSLTRNTIYMLNLATADFLYVCSLPLLVYNYASHDYWPFGEPACKLVRFQFYSNLHGSIMFLTCISFQRYLGICHPLSTWHKAGGRRTAWVVCGIVWAVVFALCIPTFQFAATGIQRNRTVCYDLSEPQHSAQYFPYGMALTCLGFLLPFLAIVFCYCCMARFLCHSGARGGLTLWTGRAAEAAQEKKDKAARMIVIVLVVFAVSFFPFHLTKTAYLLVRTLKEASCDTRNLYSVIYKSTRPFASMNSVLDPILFYFTQPRFRRSTMTLLQKFTSTRDKGSQV